MTLDDARLRKFDRGPLAALEAEESFPPGPRLSTEELLPKGLSDKNQNVFNGVQICAIRKHRKNPKYEKNKFRTNSSFITVQAKMLSPWRFLNVHPNGNGVEMTE